MKKLNKADCIKFIHVLHFINSMADLSEKGMGSFSESYDIHVLLILLVENLFEGHNQIHLNILHDILLHILLHILLIALRVIAPGFFSWGGVFNCFFMSSFVCLFCGMGLN